MTKNIIYISHAEKGPSGGAKIIYRHSEKINALKNNPKSVLLFYDKSEKIQLRVSAKVTINYKNDIIPSRL